MVISKFLMTFLFFLKECNMEYKFNYIQKHFANAKKFGNTTDILKECKAVSKTMIEF